MSDYDSKQDRNSVDFIEGFAIFAGALWIGGALLFGSLAFIGSHAVTGSPASNQISIGESNNTSATEDLETLVALPSTE